MGKGDKRRETQVPDEVFQAAWERTFGAGLSAPQEKEDSTGSREGAKDEQTKPAR